MKAGQEEIRLAGLDGKRAALIQGADFNFGQQGRKVEVALAASLFSHLHMNLIMCCLTSLHGSLAAGAMS
ncbi:MAG TPA: hypothetical protein VLG68_09555 [Gammaproteobacteria bacterium]|nr:hypothetical protein [Gammaproteobacteria bacterium]